MKKLIFLIGILSYLATACTKDDFEVKPPKEQYDPLENYLIRIAEDGLFLLGNTQTRSGRHRTIDTAHIKAATTTETRSGESDTLFYVVNFADSAGFALIDADTTSEHPIYAITEKGSYTPGEVTNTGFDDFIDQLYTKLPPVPIDTSCLIPQRQREEEYIEVISEVTPLIPVQWDQGSPYNRFCPAIPNSSSGAQCAAGCVAIAIAQILAYHQYPDSYTMSWNGANQTKYIPWAIMSNHNTCGDESCIADTEIALLIREIGHRVHMDYGVESGANVEDARDCLKSFGYYRLGTRDENWDLIQSELQLSRPLYIRGRNNDDDGHAWILDGYKITRIVTKTYEETIPGSNSWRLIGTSYTPNTFYVHYNWGWGGNYDGYFYFGNYQPASSQPAYSHDVELVPGIYPMPIK